MKKKICGILAVVLVLALIIPVAMQSKTTAVYHEKDKEEKETESEEEEEARLKIGVILIGDETEEYTKAQIDAILDSAEKNDIPTENIIWKERVDASGKCLDVAGDLVKQGCTLIISTCSGYETFMAKAAKKYPDVNFVAADEKRPSVLNTDNFYHAYVNTTEADYLAGVAAGMKLKELKKKDKISSGSFTEEGKIKIGYVGTLEDEKTQAQYLSFLGGIHSVIMEVEPEIRYTGGIYNMDAESTAADIMIKSGCVLIGQNSSSPCVSRVVEKAKENGYNVYSVGYYNSMLDVAPESSLLSVQPVWSVYYNELFYAVKNEKEIPKLWTKGYKEGAVVLTEAGKSMAKGTQKKMKEKEKGWK